jgi:hypothetical protein
MGQELPAPSRSFIFLKQKFEANAASDLKTVNSQL